MKRAQNLLTNARDGILGTEYFSNNGFSGAPSNMTVIDRNPDQVTPLIAKQWKPVSRAS